MANLFSIGVTNAMVVTVLAVVVWCVTRVWRQPPLAHLLWVLVLVKLITPPLVCLPWHLERRSVGFFGHNNDVAPAIDQTEIVLPSKNATIQRSTASDEIVSSTPAPVTALSGTVIAADTERIPVEGHRSNDGTPHARVDWVSLATTAWLVGSSAWLLIAVLRLMRFHRALRNTQPCLDEVGEWAEEIAVKFGATGRFRLRMTDARISPMVWPIGRPTIVLSRPLLAKLSPDETKTLLAHELAHLRRKDHWVRWLEFAVTAVYWWHPVTWWVRRRIHTAEEQACDAWVVWALPGAAKRYASALFKAVQMATEVRPKAPLVASRLGSSGNLKERIEDIMNATWKCRLTWPACLSIALIALVILPFSLQTTTEAAERAEAADDLAGDDDVLMLTVRNEHDPFVAETSSAEARPANENDARYVVAPPPKEQGSSSATAEKIHPGMRVRIQVENTPPDKPINDEYAIEPGGTVALGAIYGRVRIEGMTIDQAEVAVKEHLKTIIRDPAVQITFADMPAERRRERVPEHSYHIAPGDVLNVIVARGGLHGEPIADDYIVEPSGSVALGPAYGRAKVGSLTLEEAETAIAKHLGLDDNQEAVQVTLGGWRNKLSSSAGRRDGWADKTRDASLVNENGNRAPAEEAQLEGSATLEEIEALREHVEFLQQQFAKLDALYQTASRGGSADTRAMAGYELAMAQCNLSLAQGERDKAVAACEQAAKFADEGLKAVTASYEAGRRTHDVVLKAAQNLTDCKRRLAQLRLQASTTERRKVVADESSPFQRGLPQSDRTSAESISSASAWKKIVESKKLSYDRAQTLAKKRVISTAELDSAKIDHELAVARYEHAKRELRYSELQCQLAVLALQKAVDANKAAPNAVSEYEIKKLQIEVEMAKVRMSDVE
jgi:beta-lactamase regulating signal transducer with metallopeptidase domain/protein involved in polysaccharide export with SLBB domain